MKIISHRGNIDGPNLKKENNPDYIDLAISLGYDVEIDLRIKDDNLYLGHDYEQYLIDYSWLLSRNHKLWVHCKDLEAVKYLLNKIPNINYFCHTSDDFVLTNNNKIWLHDLNLKMDQDVIIPLLSKDDIDSNEGILNDPYAICTDYVTHLENKK